MQPVEVTIQGRQFTFSREVLVAALIRAGGDLDVATGWLTRAALLHERLLASRTIRFQSN